MPWLAKGWLFAQFAAKTSPEGGAMVLRIGQIAKELGAEAFGNESLLIHGLAEPAMASERDLALAMSSKYEAALEQTRAKAAVVWPGANWQALGLEAAIVAPRPRLAMSGLTQVFEPGLSYDGVHPTAIIDDTAEIGAGTHIGPFTVIGPNVRIGQDSWIGSHVSITGGGIIGETSILFDGVRIGRRVQIGARAVLHPNVVIGADGFSFVTQDPSNEERALLRAGERPLDPPNDAIRHRIHSLGGVIVGDDVEIGANSTVDAGTIRATTVGRGTKIDNLVQVGHNVVIGEDCVLCAHAAVAGSAKLGDRVVMGGKSGIRDNVTVGSDVVLAGGAIVLGKVKQGLFMMGYPAVEMKVFREQQKALRRLQQKP